MENVSAGRDVADRSGEALLELVANAEELAGLLTNISSATQEQSLNIHQANNAITEIEINTQKNAGLVEEASVSTKELERQAQDLNNILAVFKTNER